MADMICHKVYELLSILRTLKSRLRRKPCFSCLKLVNPLKTNFHALTAVRQKSVNLDDGKSTSFVPPSERNSTFNNYEVNMLHRLFSDMITENVMINSIEIKNRCLRSEDGQKLLNKVPLVQILNHIKYERQRKYLHPNKRIDNIE